MEKKHKKVTLEDLEKADEKFEKITDAIDKGFQKLTETELKI